MKDRERLRRHTDTELRDAQIAAGLALDKAHDAGRGTKRAQKRYWLVSDEQDRRKMESHGVCPVCECDTERHGKDCCNSSREENKRTAEKVIENAKRFDRNYGHTKD